MLPCKTQQCIHIDTWHHHPYISHHVEPSCDCLLCLQNGLSPVALASRHGHSDLVDILVNQYFLSAFHAFMGSFLNYLYNHGTIRQLSVRLWYHLSTFHTSAIHSAKFHQISVLPRDLPSTFHAAADIPSTFFASAQPLATSINFQYVCWTFRELFLWQRNLPSNFRAFAGPSINFSQVFVHPRKLLWTNCCRRTFCQHQLTFRASAWYTVNLRQLFVRLGDLLSTLHPTGWTSVNFPCVRGTCQIHSTSLYYSVVQAVQEFPTPNSWNILLWFFSFQLLSSSSSSAVLNFLEQKKNSSFILVPLIILEFKQFNFFNHLENLRHYPMILLLLIPV